MERITALGTEYLNRAELFKAFVESFKTRAPQYFPSIVFEDGGEPDVVTFRFLGRRLRIRHSFAVEEHCEAFSRTTSASIPSNWATPDRTPSKVRSTLVLLGAKNDPDEDELLAGPLTVMMNGKEWRIESASDPWTSIVAKPESAFRELLIAWLGPKETSKPQ